jgi:hypothetical protein
VNVS